MAKTKRKNYFTVTVASLIALVLVLYMFCFTVRQTEVAVVTFFGKPDKPITKPGLVFKWPWPIQRVYRFDARVQVYEGVFLETLTRDKKNLTLSVAVGWRVDPQRAVTFLENTQSLERCQDLLEPYVRDAKTKVVGQYDFRNFASIIPDDLKHAQMEEEIKRLINDGARTPGEGTPVARGVRQQLGIEVALVKLKRVELPQEVASKVFERMKNERKIEADGYRAEGRAISKDIRSRAEAAYKAILSMAEGDAEAIKGKGEAEAAEFFKELHKHPDLALFLLQVRALPKVAEKLTIILDPTVPPFNLLLGVPDVKVQPQAK